MKSIRHQLTRQLVASLAGLLAVGLIGVYLAVRHELIEAVDATLRARALAITALTEIEQGKPQFDFSPDFLASYPAERSRRYFEVRNAAGVALARSPSLGAFDLPWQVGGTPQRPKCYNVTLPKGRPGRAAALIFTVTATGEEENGSTADLQLIEAADRTELNENLGGIIIAVIACGVLLVAAVFWIVPRVLAGGLAPLEALGQQAERIDANSLASRFSSETLPAELQPIGRRLNELLARLEASFERERRFSADLAHELRTPLAELRNLAECALKWPEARDAEQDCDVLAIALQMETLATRMLTLARGERGQLVVQFEPTDMAAVVKTVWQGFSKRAAARGIFATFLLPTVTAHVDPALLRSILENLFDNAADYAPNDGEVRITGEWSESGYSLQIANSARTLDDRDVGQIFDRFWRKETARTGGEHTGLGLNLARTFAEAMGWRLTAKMDAAGWIAFTLSETDPRINRTRVE